MGLLDASYSTVQAMPRRSDRIQEGTPLNMRGLLDAATNLPVVGDALSGGMAVYDAVNGDYPSAAMNALGVLPFVSAGMIKGAGKASDALSSGKKLTEFEQRHLTAQKNAALPVEHGGLGLPANNTAMDRAIAMGFDTPAYHGTMRDFNEFKNSALGKNTGAKSATMAHFFAKSPETPNSYLPQWGMGKDYGTHLDAPPMYEKLFSNPDAFAKFTSATNDSEKWKVLEEIGMNHGRGRVLPVQLNLGKNLEKDYVGGYRDETYAEILAKAKKTKKDSVSFLNTSDPGGEWGSQHLLNNETIYAVMKPENIRSRFAAFDPMRRHEADLLGYADPYLLGTIGGVGLAGTAAYKYGQDK